VLQQQCYNNSVTTTVLQQQCYNNSVTTTHPRNSNILKMYLYSLISRCFKTRKARLGDTRYNCKINLKDVTEIGIIYVEDSGT
jgi:hypothetical protein